MVLGKNEFLKRVDILRSSKLDQYTKEVDCSLLHHSVNCEMHVDSDIGVILLAQNVSG